MDMSAVTTMIGSLGFPIVMCVFVLKMLNDERQDHKSEMDKVTEALNNNTLVLQRLLDKLDSGMDVKE